MTISPGKGSTDDCNPVTADQESRQDADQNKRSEGEEDSDSSISEVSSVVSSSDSDSSSAAEEDADPNPRRSANAALSAAQSNPLRDRLAAFLPQIESANQALDTSRPSGFEVEDDADEHVGDRGRVVEMDLDLGVLEEKRNGGGRIRLKESPDAESSGDEQDERDEQDRPLRKLRGFGGDTKGIKGGIEVVDGGNEDDD